MRNISAPISGLAGTVAANVRAEMARHRVSGAALAKQLGWSTSALSRRLTGDRAFALDELEAVAAALDVRVEHLIARAAA